MSTKVMTLKSVSYGVSKQPFETRIEGQHEEQVNMLSDPLVGLTRRWGTVQKTRKMISTAGRLENLSEFQRESVIRYMSSWADVEYVVEGRTFTVLYPTTHRPESVPENILPSEFIAIESLGYGDYKIFPVYYSSRASWQFARGFSAVTQVGEMLVFCPKYTIFDKSTQVDWHGMAENASKVVLSLSVGNYSRTYTMQVVRNGIGKWGSYTTLSQNIQNDRINTDNIQFNNPNFTQLLNLETTRYNNAVTEHIRTAGWSITPRNIFDQLRATYGFTFWGSVLAQGGDIAYEANSLGLIIPGLWSVTAGDNGPNTDIKIVHQVVKDSSELSSVHYPGKVVAVRPFKDSPTYYVRAEGKVTQNQGSLQPVTWKECAIWSPNTFGDLTTFPFTLLTVAPNGQSLDVYTDPSAIPVPVGQEKIKGLGVRQAGDGESNPPPYWYGREVHYMGMFQDRLLIGSGSTISASAIGDYFNWYRDTVLTVKDSDPLELVAASSDGDTIRYSVPFDKDILLFGDKYQYIIDGSSALTPIGASMARSSTMEGTTLAQPRGTGDFVFFAKAGEDSSALYQMEVGSAKDTRNSTNVSLQVDGYINGKIIDICTCIKPDMVFVRTDKEPYKVYVFKYIQQDRKRVLESWCTWDYGQRFGVIMGMVIRDSTLILTVYRSVQGEGGGTGYICVEEQSLSSHTSPRPYLDSMRYFTDFFNVSNINRDLWNQDYVSLAIGKDPWRPSEASTVASNWLQGVTPAPSTPEALARFNEDVLESPEITKWVGMEYPSYVTLSPPVAKDYKSEPMIDGKYKVNGVKIGYKESSGMYVQIRSKYKLKSDPKPFSWSTREVPEGTLEVLADRNRTLGTDTSQIGVVPVTDNFIWAKIGRSNTDYLATIYARTWMPLTITSITYRGQWYAPI